MALALLLAIGFLGARFADGPLGPIPDGALEAGELVETPVTDWGFTAEIPEIPGTPAPC